MHNLEFVFIFALFSVVRARQVNITIDDREGAGGILAPQFFPPERWNTEDCPLCWVIPDPTKAHGGTWRDTTAHTGDPTLSFTLNFEGVAVYIYFILANRNPRGADTDTACTFFIDGEEESTFYHTPDTSTTELLYDQLAFSKTGLAPNETHRLLGEIPKDEGDGWWVAFDYAIVTVEEPDPEEPKEDSEDETSASLPSTSTSSGSMSNGAKIGVIVGSVLGVIILLGLILFFWLQRRRRLRKPSPVVDLLSDGPLMAQADSSIGASSNFAAPLLASQGSSPPSSFNPYPAVSSHYPASSVETASRYDLTGSSQWGSTGFRGVNSEIGGPTSISETSSLSRRDTLRDVRLRELEREVTLARQALFAAQAGSQPIPSRSAKLREVEQTAATENLRSQVTDLQERIRQLEAAQSSPWAQGYSDNPPPGYTPSPQ